MVLRLSLTAVVSCLVLAPAAFGQGISEYGGLLGAQGKPSGSLVNTLTQTYGSAGQRVDNAINGSNYVSNIGHIHAMVSPEEAASYGKQANNYYLAGQAALKQGNSHEAIRQFSSALLIRQRIWGDADPAVGQILLQQAELYRKTGALHDCENNYRRLLAINTKRYGPGAKELDKTICSLADLCERQCDTTDALSFYRQLVAIRQRYELPDSACLKSARLKLATALTETCDYPAAEQIFKDAIAHEDASATPDNAYLCKCLDSYGGLLRETFRSDEAVKVEDRQRQLMTAMKTSKPCNAATTATANATVLPATTSTGPAPGPAQMSTAPASAPAAPAMPASAPAAPAMPASTPMQSPTATPEATAAPASTPKPPAISGHHAAKTQL
jgi:tetratricopeptide (TPR) repeat protein